MARKYELKSRAERMEETRRRIVVSGLLAAVLAGMDAVGIGLLPTLVDRLQGRDTGLLKGFSTPAVATVVVVLLITKSVGVDTADARIRALISFVTCGITCTVAPRNSPFRSLRRTESQIAPAV